MSQDFVTHVQLRDSLEALEERMDQRRQEFEKRMDAFADEMKGHVKRISEQSPGARKDLIDSNSKLVEEWRRVSQQVAALDAAVKELRSAKREHETATRSLTKELDRRTTKYLRRKA